MSRSQAEMEARYDAERNGTLYTKPGSDTVWAGVLDITDDPANDGREISPDEERALDILLADEDAVNAWIDAARTPADQPFGQLANGTVIYGTFDTTKVGAGRRSGCVTIETPAIMLTADCDGFVSGENRRGDDWSINFDGASLAEIHALRDFLNSGAVERMLAAAVAWEHGDTEPPAFVQ
jgi:hypothetical protein